MLETERSTLSTQCPACSQPVQIAQQWTAGGIIDYGGYVLKCSRCGHVYHLRLGRDINDSLVVSGASVVEAYDDDVGNKAEVLSRHGLQE